MAMSAKLMQKYFFNSKMNKYKHNFVLFQIYLTQVMFFPLQMLTTLKVGIKRQRKSFIVYIYKHRYLELDGTF